jgi:hypothetical protein
MGARRLVITRPFQQRIGIGRDDRDRANPLTRSGVFPILPHPAETERLAILHGDGIGLLALLAPHRAPLVEAVHRQDAATPAAVSHLALIGLRPPFDPGTGTG